MTHSPDIPIACLDDPAELRRFLGAYRPSDVPADVWLGIAQDANDLVFRAGRLTRLRVEKDIQCVGHVVAHLVDRGRQVSMDAVLDDTTLLSYDVHLQKRSSGTRTRENQRGILRRLQATHRDLPWRQSRRPDGERIAAMIQPDALAEIRRLETLASELARDPRDDEAMAFLESLAAARSARTGTTGPITTDTWTRARRFATRRGTPLDKRTLAAAVTYEVLEQHAPVAVLSVRFALTRRDLDLALTQANALPITPPPADRALLRGAPMARSKRFAEIGAS